MLHEQVTDLALQVLSPSLLSLCTGLLALFGLSLGFTELGFIGEDTGFPGDEQTGDWAGGVLIIFCSVIRESVSTMF